jgi:hypothetical protein
MRARSLLAAAGLAALAAVAATSCGGGGSGSTLGSGGVSAPPAANVAAVIVDSGPDPKVANGATVNTLYTTVTVCVPGSTTECQTIDHIEVDTQSVGLRIIANVLNPTLSTLGIAPASDGSSLVECTQFAGGAYSWGPVAVIDFTIGGETASRLPIQLIGDSRFPTVPIGCSGTGTAQDTVVSFGANGLLGIGVFEQDCGSNCNGFGVYYSCTQSGCIAEQTVTTQVLNPVPLFAKDNNGTFIVLPAVSAPGAVTVSGSLIFGIDTESNNASGSSQTVLQLDSNAEFITVFNGKSFASFIDSGSSGIFFSDNFITQCMDATGYYCPSSTDSFTASLTDTSLPGSNNVSYSASFNIGNADTLFSNNPSLAALPTLGGVFGDQTTFDWGLPFFYGKRLATAIEKHTTSLATPTPYMAF